jgi:hypothetical protein
MTREKSDLLGTKLLEMAEKYVNLQEKGGLGIGIDDIKRSGLLIMCIEGQKKSEDKYWLLTGKQAEAYTRQNSLLKGNILVNTDELLTLYKLAEATKTTKKVLVKQYRDYMYEHLSKKAELMTRVKNKVA